jgi:carboxylesterase
MNTTRSHRLANVTLDPGQGNPEPFHYGHGGEAPSRTGVLLVHGWSGTPAEMRGLGEYLAGQGVTVQGVLLPGHGADPRELLRTRWQHWAAEVGQALARLQASCDTVFVGGLSMGAVLALYMGATTPRPLAGVIALAPPIYFKDWRITALPLIKVGVRWHTKGPSSLEDPEAVARLWHYPRLPTESIYQMTRLARETRRVLPRLRAPLLVMQGRHDTTIHPGCGAYVYEHAGSADKTLTYFERSGHILTEDVEREAVWAGISDFIGAHTPAAVGAAGR